MGGAAYFGLALISGSKLVLALAVLRHLANWWFLSSVEQCVPNSRSPSSARTPLIDVLFPFFPSSPPAYPANLYLVSDWPARDWLHACDWPMT